MSRNPFSRVADSTRSCRRLGAVMSLTRGGHVADSGMPCRRHGKTGVPDRNRRRKQDLKILIRNDRRMKNIRSGADFLTIVRYSFVVLLLSSASNHP